MSDGGKIGGRGPQVPTVDQTFQDDAVGGEEKNSEKKQKVSRDQRNKHHSQQLAARMKKVQAAQFSDGRDTVNDAEQVAELENAAQVQLQKAVRPASSSQQQGGREPGLPQAQQEMALAMGEVDRTLQQLELAARSLGSETKLAAEGGPAAELSTVAEATGKLVQQLEGADLKTLSRELQRAYARVRLVFQALLAGEYGFRLLNDPHLSFKPVLAKIGRWPKTMPPGRHPLEGEKWSEAEWDAFLAWVYAPPAPPRAEPML